MRLIACKTADIKNQNTKKKKKGKVSADLQKLMGVESSLQHFPEESPSGTIEELQVSSSPVS